MLLPMQGTAAQGQLASEDQINDMLIERWTKIPGNCIRGYQDRKTHNFLGDMVKEDRQKAATLARLYEATYQELNKLNETTRLLNVGSYEKLVNAA